MKAYNVTGIQLIGRDGIPSERISPPLWLDEPGYLRAKADLLERIQNHQKALKELESIVPEESPGYTREGVIPPLSKMQEALMLLDEAVECFLQSYQMSGTVDEKSPGGQLTAHRRDGTPIDRTVFLKEARELVAKVLKNER